MPPQLEERFYETQRAQLLRWLPWLYLFRAFRIALDARKILLGTLAAIALAAGDAAIDALPFAPAPLARVQSIIFVPGASLEGAGSRFGIDALPGRDAWPGILRPLLSVVDAGARLFRRENAWADVAYAWTKLLFYLSVWSLLGAAIARIAAVQFARRESVRARDALRYAAARFRSTIGAPLLPLVFIGFFWIICLLLGLVGRLPGIGPTIVGLLWFLPLLIGVALAVILIVIAASWPLMVATISTEGTDAFDGLSRGYDYVLNRTWYVLWLTFLMILYGTVVLLFVEFVANAALSLAHWGVKSGMGEFRLAEVVVLNSPLPRNPLELRMPGTTGIAGAAATFWVRTFAWLLQGLVISYFWTAVTIIYFLLRLSLDAKPLDHVYLPESADIARGLPLVGMPASERREQQGGDTPAETPDPPGGDGSTEQPGG